MFRRATLVILTAVALLPGAPLETAERGWTPERMLTVRRILAVVPSPDGTRVAFVASEAVMQGDKSEWLSHVHIANAEGAGSFQLTRGDKSATVPRWSPDGQWVGFLSTRGGDKANIFRIRVAGGEAEQLTSGKAPVGAFEWSPDGASIAFTMAEPKTEEEEKAAKEKRDARVIDEHDAPASLYVMPVEKNAEGKRPSNRLTRGAIHVIAMDWSPDSSSLVFSHQPTTKVFDPNDVSIVRVSGGAPRSLAATKAHETNPVFSRDGKWVAYVTSDEPVTWAFTGWVRLVASEGGSPRALARTFDEQPNIVGWSADGRALYVTETHGTVGRLALLPVDGGAPTLVSPAEVNVTTPAVNAAGTAIGFVHQWSDKAPEPYASSLRKFDPRQVASVQSLPSQKDAPIGRTDVIRWKSADGTEIEGLLTYPVGYQRGSQVPLLVAVHGGPTGVFTRAFIGMPGPYPMPVFAERGYAVLRVNPRGSSGYGRAFRYGNYQDWGGGDYRDIMTGVDHVIGMGVADPGRLGIMGWSYGGYMTSWAITQTKRFKAASVGAGVTNLMSFTGTADIPGFVPDYLGGEYWDQFDRWRARSAMFHVKGVTTPTLIQHGDQDLRVPVSQGYELYNALRRQNVPTKMVVYPRQPHGIQEPQLIKDAMERNLEWFDRWIKERPGTQDER